MPPSSAVSSPAASSVNRSSPSPSSASPTAVAKRASRLARFWVIFLSTLVLGIILFFIIRLFGYVEGEEFSPTHFRSRSFTFYEIPIIRWQITPISRKSTTPVAAVTLAQKKLIPTPAGTPTTWHLVSIQYGGDTAIDDDAALLMKQLRYHSGGGPFWKVWSNDHPELAKEFWPIIGKLSQRELYLLMPPIFEIVRQTEDPAILKALIEGYLQNAYTDLVRDMRDAGRNDLAEALESEAASDLGITQDPSE